MEVEQVNQTSTYVGLPRRGPTPIRNAWPPLSVPGGCMVELEVRWGDGACRQWALRGGQRAVSVHAYSVDASIWKAARFPPTPPPAPTCL